MTTTYRIALGRWAVQDELAESIGDELLGLGHSVIPFLFNAIIPRQCDVILTFAPHGRWWPIARQIRPRSTTTSRPIFVHWNFEGQPSLRFKPQAAFGLGAIRAWMDRLNDSSLAWVRRGVQPSPAAFINRHLHKFRYLGEYEFAFRQGILDILIESSEIFAARFQRRGLLVQVVPWGTSKRWYQTLNLKRDIDVLWLGQRRTRHRSDLLDRLRRELAAAGIHLHIVDNIEHPFVYAAERNQLFNRAKITLSLLPTPNDNSFPYRFHLAAGNRSVVVSDPLMRHTARYEAGRDYIAAPIESLAQTIRYYLQHEAERAEIAENAFRLVTTDLTLRNSLAAVVEAIDGFQSSLKGTI
ncbi:MAG TPA: glycosyltransferase [Anaerolineae bacterium]|nr:glycosyltransferase [Anaerolineae bacterium]